MLEFGQVSKGFGGKPVLSSLTFTVRPGELYGFCGANGAGKTTAMRIAMGMLTADSGQVRWHDKPVDSATRRRFGYMPEERGLYAKMRPRDQLAYFARLSGVPGDVAAKRADEWIERLGVRVGPKDNLEKLSLGNQQKIQLIAALIHEPEALILDEPFSGLDPIAVDAMTAVLAEFSQRGVPVLFSSHQLELVERLCDRVGIIRGGAIVAEGTVDQLKRTAGAWRLRVVLAGARSGWAAKANGAKVISERDTEVVLELDENASLPETLAFAQANGDVEHFGVVEPTLAEVFRESVTQ